PQNDYGRIMGAIALPDERIFTWDADRNMCLWDADMTLIATLTSDYWEGKRQIIFAWAKEHGILGADLYPDDVALGNYR
ncbi:MAG TPA: hypothetical protein PLZ51_18430, partial [Aggregatilineales bacterium]|nr:hypothetical protein [Aggregatilineales bacterium]